MLVVSDSARQEIGRVINTQNDTDLCVRVYIEGVG